MKLKLNKNKKIILGACGIVALGALSSLTLVSCSNNKAPNVQAAVTYECGNIKLQTNGANQLYCIAGDFNGFKSAPSIDSNNKITYDAWNKFSALQTFTSWLFPFVSNFQNLFSVWTINNFAVAKSSLIPEQLQTAIALSTPIGQGYNTVRYGLQSISFTNSQWPEFSNFINSSNANNLKVSFSNISLNFNWWETSDGSNVIWKGDNFNPNNELSTSANWDKWTSEGITPPKKTSIKFTLPVSLELKPQMIDNKATGIFESSSDSIGLNNDKAQAKEFADTLAYVYKISHGDINNVEFNGYYNENKTLINKILKSFSLNVN